MIAVTFYWIFFALYVFLLYDALKVIIRNPPRRNTERVAVYAVIPMCLLTLWNIPQSITLISEYSFEVSLLATASLFKMGLVFFIISMFLHSSNRKKK